MSNIEIDHDVSLKAAQIAGASSEMDRVADAIEMRVKTIAANHRLTGAFIRSIHTTTDMGVSGRGRYVQDRVVYTTDPEALHFELGHLTGKRPHSTGDRWVPGLRIFGKAVNASRR